MPSRPDPLTRAYQARVEAIHREVERRLVALYGDRIDSADIKATFDRYIGDAESIIAGGQASVASLAEAYLESRAARAGVALALDDLGEDVIGTTRDGSDLPTGMAAFGGMVLGQISIGRTVEQALEYGQYLATRFADSELTGTADRIRDDPVVRDRLTGWEGVVSAESCDPCKSNEGSHELADEIYRHPGCDCVWVPVFGAG